MTAGPEAVVLDMDGLLLDSERIYRDGFRRAQAAFDLPVDDTLYHSLIGTTHAGGGVILRAAVGDLAEALDTRWGEEIRAAMTGPVPLRPTVLASVEALAARGIPMIVATSTRRATARARLDAAGLGGFLPRLVGGDEVTRGKPDPEIFLAAADRIGVPPVRCAAFEDSENGVRAAVAAGMVVTQVPDLVEPSDDLRTLGHRIAPDLATGLAALGLL